MRMPVALLILQFIVASLLCTGCSTSPHITKDEHARMSADPSPEQRVSAYREWSAQDRKDKALTHRNELLSESRSWTLPQKNMKGVKVEAITSWTNMLLSLRLRLTGDRKLLTREALEDQHFLIIFDDHAGDPVSFTVPGIEFYECLESEKAANNKGAYQVVSPCRMQASSRETYESLITKMYGDVNSAVTLEIH